MLGYSSGKLCILLKVSLSKSETEYVATSIICGDESSSEDDGVAPKAGADPTSRVTSVASAKKKHFTLLIYFSFVKKLSKIS